MQDVEAVGTMAQGKDQDRGPKYFVNIEGEVHPWDSETITTEQITQLGGWDPSLGVLEIDLKTNESHTLSPGQVVELKPGQGFAKKIQWKRGMAE